MPTGKQIFFTHNKKIGYEYFLYSFPEDAFFDKITEMEDLWQVPVGEFVKDELYRIGLLGNRGKYRIGPKMRAKITQYLIENPMPLPDRPIKNPSMKARQRNGQLQLLEIGRVMGFDIFCENSGVVIWSRKLGVLAVAGNSWCYVYRTGHSIQMNKNFPVIGYFQLAGSDIQGQLMKAINGELQDRADALSERRKAYILRQKRNQKYMGNK